MERYSWRENFFRISKITLYQVKRLVKPSENQQVKMFFTWLYFALIVQMLQKSLVNI